MVRVRRHDATTLGRPADLTIWLGANAAGWGWFVDRSWREDSEFATAGNQGEQGRMDLLTALAHELGHLLGFDHSEGGVMDDTLATGIRRMPSGTHTASQLAAWDIVLAEEDEETPILGDLARKDLLASPLASK